MIAWLMGFLCFCALAELQRRILTNRLNRALRREKLKFFWIQVQPHRAVGVDIFESALHRDGASRSAATTGSKTDTFPPTTCPRGYMQPA